MSVEEILKRMVSKQAKGESVEKPVEEGGFGLCICEMYSGLCGLLVDLLLFLFGL